MEKSVSVQRAQELISRSVDPAGIETISAAAAQGRILAGEVVSPLDQPPWPRSPLDGYAFRASDSCGAEKKSPVSLRVVGMLCAGDWPELAVGPGQAVRIMTGAPIPPDCDCVLRQEDTDLGMETVRIYKELRPWDNYCRAGEDFRAGDVILSPGTRLTGNALGTLAAAGLLRREVSLSVYRRARIALLCTGEELSPSSVYPLPRGKIYSSAAAAISSRLEQLGAEVTFLREELRDDAALLCETMRLAAESADALITTGGVSVGVKDMVPEALSLLGAKPVFSGVRLKPGSPLSFSLRGRMPILSLSGNPFAAGATFELFGRELLSALMGCEDLLPQRVQGQLATPFPKDSPVCRYVRAAYRAGRVTLPQGHSSGQLASAAGCNCLAELPAGKGPFAAGDTVWVYLL